MFQMADRLFSNSPGNVAVQELCQKIFTVSASVQGTEEFVARWKTMVTVAKRTEAVTKELNLLKALVLRCDNEKPADFLNLARHDVFLSHSKGVPPTPVHLMESAQAEIEDLFDQLHKSVQKEKAQTAKLIAFLKYQQESVEAKAAKAEAEAKAKAEAKAAFRAAAPGDTFGEKSMNLLEKYAELMGINPKELSPDPTTTISMLPTGISLEKFLKLAGEDAFNHPRTQLLYLVLNRGAKYGPDRKPHLSESEMLVAGDLANPDKFEPSFDLSERKWVLEEKMPEGKESTRPLTGMRVPTPTRSKDSPSLAPVLALDPAPFSLDTPDVVSPQKERRASAAGAGSDPTKKTGKKVQIGSSSASRFRKPETRGAVKARYAEKIDRLAKQRAKNP